MDESTYKELDSQFDKLKSDHFSFGNLGDIDLSFLISKMYPESEVKLCQDIWTLDSLYKNISKEFSKSSTWIIIPWSWTFYLEVKLENYKAMGKDFYSWRI